MGNKVITISREFGSGGHFIGEELAKKLGVRYYDKDIIDKVAEETGLSAKFVETQGEYAPTKNFFSYSFIGRDASGASLADQIFVAQTKIIREIAEKESCVIIGRCADYILKDNPDCVHAFIYGDTKIKAERIQKLYNKSEKEALALMKEMDKKRSINYKYCTDQTWGNNKNYTITLNSSKLGFDTCVNILAQL